MARVTKGQKSLIKFIATLLLIYAAFYYVDSHHKSELDKFYLKFDRLGITEIGRNENERRSKIHDLDIPLVQRDALTNGTVFFGATSEMVSLALGKPISEPRINDKGEQVWIYNFDDYKRPTYLNFRNENNVWVLRSAEKAKN